MHTSTKSSHFFSADRPIERLDDDRLQRRAFAMSIAQAIATWSGDDSLVMALYGGWGDGKSSVKGMVVDAMGKDAGTRPFKAKALKQCREAVRLAGMNYDAVQRLVRLDQKSNSEHIQPLADGLGLFAKLAEL